MFIGTLALRASLADDVLYRYEGQVLPYDKSAGWLIFDACEEECSESVENGHLVLEWIGGESVNYTYIISNDAGEPPVPPTLWVEWRFRSNQPFGGMFYTCDGTFVTRYRRVSDLVQMFGDAVISHSGDQVVRGLDVDRFNTYRFESLDGANYRFSVDGLVFVDGIDFKASGLAYLQVGGRGGCDRDLLPTVNEWDFVRYGTISYGEQIIASGPPQGFVDAREHAALDCFAVTFDSPNYVYLDEITVDVTGGVAPVVTQTRRRDNDEPDTVEIVLDRPIARGETTRFTFDDGVAVNVVEYTFAPGDTDGDGDADLRDIAASQRCFGLTNPIGACWALDLDESERFDHTDHAALVSSLTGP